MQFICCDLQLIFVISILIVPHQCFLLSEGFSWFFILTAKCIIKSQGCILSIGVVKVGDVEVDGKHVANASQKSL